MSEEIWKRVDDFPDYEVSSLGRVRRVGRVLKPWSTGPITRCGKHYLAVSLRAPGKKKAARLHRVVAMAFIPNQRPSFANDVAHNDGDVTNNRADNLRWATRKENMADCVTHGTVRLGTAAFGAKLNASKVRFIRSCPLSHSKTAVLVGVCLATVGLVRQRKIWKHVA